MPQESYAALEISRSRATAGWQFAPPLCPPPPLAPPRPGGFALPRLTLMVSSTVSVPMSTSSWVTYADRP